MRELYLLTAIGIYSKGEILFRMFSTSIAKSGLFKARSRLASFGSIRSGSVNSIRSPVLEEVFFFAAPAVNAQTDFFGLPARVLMRPDR